MAATAKARNATVELVVSPSNMYPPLLNPGLDPITVLVESDAAITLDYTLNGKEGPFPGITPSFGPAGGVLLMGSAFIANYTGGWPAHLELRAWQDGTIVGRASTRLLDTNNMVATTIRNARLLPNPARVLSEGDSEALVSAYVQFFDANGVHLPNAELSWHVELPGNPEGLQADGHRIRILPQAQPGEVAVRFRESSGLQHTTSLALNPTFETGLELELYDLYPPYRDPDPVIIAITHTMPPGSNIECAYRVNGTEGTNPGLWFEGDGELRLAVDRDFIQYYDGPWPANVEIHIIVDHQSAGMRTLRLHDTRCMVCTRVEMHFYPDSRVHIPDSGTVVVVAAPTFYDANDITLPFSELSWTTVLMDPMEGVDLEGHVLFIGPEAKPGMYRVATVLPNGVINAIPLTLI